MFPRCLAALLVCSSLLGPGAVIEAQTEDDLLRPSDTEVAYVRIDHARVVEAPEAAIELRIRGLRSDGGHVIELDARSLQVWDGDERLSSDVIRVERVADTDARLSIAIALDLTGSMQGAPLKRVKQALLQFLDSEALATRPEDRISVIGFSEEVGVRADAGLLRLDTRARIAELAVDPERSQRSRVHDGALRAIEAAREADDRRSIPLVVVYADGGDSGSNVDAEAVIAEALGAVDQSAVPIFVLGDARFGTRGLETLRRIASDTGGRYWQIDSSEVLSDRLAEIAAHMLSSHLIRAPRRFDGAAHRIEISIADATADRTMRYPQPAATRWPWLALLAVLSSAVALGASLWWWRSSVGRLTVLKGPEVGLTFPVRRGCNSLGSLPDNDIVIDSSLASRHHAELWARGGSIQIVDLRSRNGLRVNGQPVERAVLHSGDHVSIADVELIYE